MGLWMWIAWITTWALAAEPEPPIEDPRRLAELGEEALATGDRKLAEQRFGEMLDRMEVTSFFDYRAPLRDALIAERTGDLDAAARNYRAALADDPLRTVQVLRILSVHPERDRLVAEVYDHVRGLVAALERGEEAVVYVTSKGEPRPLVAMTLEQVVANARRGEQSKYCYVADLDFTKIQGEVPDTIHLERCVVGRMWGPGVHFEKLVFKGFALGDVDLGKTFEGEKNKSRTLQPATFSDLVFRDAVFVGRANFAAVEVVPGRAYFPMAVFEGEADFKGAEFQGVTEFRFASFGKGANFRFMRMTQPVYFGGTRYREDTVFSNVYSDRDVYFNEAVFEGSASFEQCEFQRGATFESTTFHGPASFGTMTVAENFNLSRARFESTVNVKEVEMGSLDALGTHFADDAWFMDAAVLGRARFSLDEVTRHTVQEDLDGLLHLYRTYQGDEDADAPLTTKSSYGVRSVEDLSSRIDRNISFANTVFSGFTVFEGVVFGQPGATTSASFFNTQFLGETHFERTVFHSRADFTTIFGKEVAFNNAHFDHGLILDDAAIQGRVTLTDASFEDAADLSFYGAEIATFQIQPEQVAGVGEPHRLFYERCALGGVDREDVRIQRIVRDEELSDDEIRVICHDFLLDEFVALKQSYGDRAMTNAEDDAYWWARHHETMKILRFGSLFERAAALIARMLIFEICFGWGVRLGNLALAAAVITLIYAVIYKTFCPNTVLQYNGDNVRIKDVPFLGICYVSLQAMIAVNTGWDFGEDDHRFRWLNVSQTVIGFIVLTFFVGAYTRMILA